MSGGQDSIAIPTDPHWQQVLAWLGFWRSKMPEEAVRRLQDIIVAANEPQPSRRR